VQAYILSEDLKTPWESDGGVWAGKLLDQRFTRPMRCKIVLMKKLARTLRHHRKILFNGFWACGEIFNGSLVGMKSEGKLLRKMAHGFKS